MISLDAFFYILIFHWIADFVAQTDKQAKMKSTSNWYLFKHVLSYSFITSVMGYMMLGIFMAPIFFIITFVAHFATDYCTSRVVKHHFDKQDYHNGFVVIGIDQVLHYMQLAFTIYYLS